MTTVSDNVRRCDFCGTESQRVNGSWTLRVIEGPKHIHICFPCAERAREIIDEGSEEKIVPLTYPKDLV